jgi:hypothetical protein
VLPVLKGRWWFKPTKIRANEAHGADASEQKSDSHQAIDKWGMGLRGYLSFILVLASLVLAFSLLDVHLALKSINFSKAVAVERTYGLQLNVKEAVAESARQGALDGFSAYDRAHDASSCRACLDHGCALMMPPACDGMKCAACFREDDARRAAEHEAEGKVAALSSHVFDDDFSVLISGFAPEARLRADRDAKNGFALDTVRLGEKLEIILQSQKFGISANATLPQGMVVLGG